MAVRYIFSKRQKKMRGEVPDVYSYDRIPDPLRGQIVHILQEIIEMSAPWGLMPNVIGILNDGVDALCREYGIFRLPAVYAAGQDKIHDLFNFVLQEQEADRVLDAVEISLSCIELRILVLARRYAKPSGEASAYEKFLSEVLQPAVEEINERFAEHAVGYRYTDGTIVRIDSEFVHAEIVKPALQILRKRMYAGAQEEFMKAHEHYRHDRPKEAINECLKALESVMKSICGKRKWRYDNKAGASRLIGICFANGLVPEFWQNHFTALRSTLESGVPAARNRVGGHGQGATPTSVPRHVAAYALHMTAAAIVFLAEAEASGAGR